jgi:hypothetical protein
MSCNRNGAPGQCDEEPGGRADGTARLLPKLSFGLSAAILAGVVIVAVAPVPSASAAGQGSVMATAGLNGAFDGPGGFTPTTMQQTACCA